MWPGESSLSITVKGHNIFIDMGSHIVYDDVYVRYFWDPFPFVSLTDSISRMNFYVESLYKFRCALKSFRHIGGNITEIYRYCYLYHSYGLTVISSLFILLNFYFTITGLLICENLRESDCSFLGLDKVFTFVFFWRRRLMFCLKQRVSENDTLYIHWSSLSSFVCL